MMLFKVGDKIRIRRDLSVTWSQLSSFGINDEMETFKGKTARITGITEVRRNINSIREYKYYLDIDDECWSWGIDMFEPINNILEIE